MNNIFAIVPIEVLLDENLTGGEIKMIVCLLSFRNKNTNLMCPSTETIAARLGLKDKTRVSKVTTSLCNKGWLKKKKGGFDKPNHYEFIVPDEYENSQVGESSQVGEKQQRQFGENSQHQVGRSSQPNRQVNKQTNKQVKDMDFSLWPEIPDFESQQWIDFVDMRKKKKAPISQTVLNQAGKVMAELALHGVSVKQAIDIWVASNWQGFKSDWVLNHLKKDKPNATNQPGRNVKQTPQQRVSAQAETARARFAARRQNDDFLGADDRAIPSQMVEQGRGNL